MRMYGEPVSLPFGVQTSTPADQQTNRPNHEEKLPTLIRTPCEVQEGL